MLPVYIYNAAGLSDSLITFAWFEVKPTGHVDIQILQFIFVPVILETRINLIRKIFLAEGEKVFSWVVKCSVSLFL